ncbi:MAG TPA: peptide chain release factor N(5)-glutamine methyltransferase [Chloroflexota bacterium]|nr:peptide chain release factor N(5)-glutamine methyltransferase [Chloroflexota bacterium]
MDSPAQQHTVKSALDEAGRGLADAGVPSPRDEARLLLACALGQPTSWVMAHPEQTPDPEALGLFHQYVARRSRLEPVAYILGRREFYSLDLQVTPAVLIPRPETEMLVEMGLTACRQLAAVRERPLRVVELGTGSGAISIALASRFSGADFLAIDSSPPALEVARRNAETHEVSRRIKFHLGSLLVDVTGLVDVLVANLPYIPSDEMPHLMPDVRLYEPAEALDGGPDGTALIRQALQQSVSLMNRPAMLLFEIGHGQGALVKTLALESYPDASVAVQLDYAGLERVLAIQIVGWC